MSENYHVVVTVSALRWKAGVSNDYDSDCIHSLANSEYLVQLHRHGQDGVSVFLENSAWCGFSAVNFGYCKVIRFWKYKICSSKEVIGVAIILITHLISCDLLGMARQSFDLLSLPARVLCDVLGERLSVKDIVRLDSAFCQNQTRDIWLTLLSSKSFVLHTKILFSNPNRLAWLLKKCLKTSRLVFGGSNARYVLPIVSEYLQKFGSSARDIWIANYENHS